MGAFEKGASLKSNYAAVRAELGEIDWLCALDQLDSADREVVLSPDKHLLVPTSITGRLYSSIHRTTCSGDRRRTQRLLHGAGRRTADDMLAGVFSVFARFVSPEQAFKRAGGIISSVYSGVEAQTIPRETGNGGVLILSGFSDYPFAACLLCGWIERALERFGARNVSVVEKGWASGQDSPARLTFDLSWDSQG